MTHRLTHHPLENRQTRAVTIRDNVTCGEKPLWIVGGPCSVEGASQLQTVSQALIQLGINSLRGGAFKPRTSPYAFQGMEAEGLALLGQMRQEYGLTIVSEVMTESQIEATLPHVDVLQVGARNMQNFNLLKALGELDKPILLKRGLAATIDEFLWAAEYVMAGGNHRVILCERGIRSFDSETRNVLDLGAVAVLTEKSHLPVVVDPSHAAGRRDILAALSRAAIAVGADGLLLETHPDPDRSVSDAAQALSLQAFAELLEEVAPIALAMNRSMPTLTIPHQSLSDKMVVKHSKELVHH